MTLTRQKKRYNKQKKRNKKFCSSGKVRFKTKMDADLAILHVYRKTNNQIKLSYPYYCNLCHNWHLTSRIKSLSGYEYGRH